MVIEEFEAIELSEPTLPKIPCVYFLMNDFELNYVGNTRNLRLRMSHHKRKIRDSNELFNWILFIEIEDDKTRMELERKYILEFEPKWNYNTGPFTPPVPNPWTGEIISNESCYCR